jgi:thioesterase domain-containing protein/acyl carrier protein
VQATDLRRHVEDRLPDYMVPALVLVDRLPLGPTGKVDRRALPEPREAIEGGGAAPRDALELQLVKIWESALGKPVGVRDNFFEAGGHSLLAVRVFSQIEKAFGKELPLATLFQAPTVERLAEVLRRKGWGPNWRCLVPIQPGGARRAFFCVHPFGGNVLCYEALSRRLGPEQPFFGLQARGLDGRTRPHRRIEDMAADYIAEIRTVQPEGPYLLGGACAGGLIALEMAQQLLAEGQGVALLVVMDTILPPIRGRAEARRVLRDVWLQTLRRLERNLAAAVTDAVRRVSKRFLALVDAKARRAGRVRRAFDIARWRYRPRVYPGRITFFRARDPYLWSRRRIEAWASLAGGGLDCRQVSVDHMAMLSEPHVQHLARELRECIDASETTPAW